MVTEFSSPTFSLRKFSLASSCPCCIDSVSSFNFYPSIHPLLKISYFHKLLPPNKGREEGNIDGDAGERSERREKSEEENLNQERRERSNKKEVRREEGSRTKIVFLIHSLSLSLGNGYLPSYGWIRDREKKCERKGRRKK